MNSRSDLLLVTNIATEESTLMLYD